MIDNIDSMSLEDLKAYAISQNEIVRELENQIKEMKDDAESKVISDAESKEDDAQEMTEKKEDDAQEMTEKEDDKKSYAMSELNQATLLNEVRSLREHNNKLSKRLEAIEAEKLDIEMRSAVSSLLSDGRITPAEVDYAHSAYKDKELRPEFWQMFSERPPHSAIPLAQIGHGASGAEISKATLDIEVKKLAAEKAISYSEALTQFRTSNPDYYNQAFGG